MKKSFITLFGLAALAPAWAQDAASARLAYQDRQNLAEVPRLIQQFNQLAENQDQIAARLVKVETGSGDSAELRAEIDKLRGEIAELRAAVRRDQDAMRREIVADLTAPPRPQRRPRASRPTTRSARRRVRRPPPRARPAEPPRNPPHPPTRALITNMSSKPGRRSPSSRRASTRPCRRFSPPIPASKPTRSAWGRN